MSVIPVNINGINQLSLNLAGTVTASTAAGITTINQTGVVGLALEVNGNPNGSQTLLNLQQGTNTTITDNGTGTVTVAVPTATTSTTGAVKPDGTSIVVTGGVISAAASGILFYGDASATCLGGESVVTLGSTPIAGSVSLLLNGVLINTSQYTLTGSVATLVSNTFGVGDIVRAKWSTTNSTPGSITITDTANTLHSYSASSNSGGVGSNIQPTLPAAASAGDFAVMCIGSSNGSLPSTPSGWTLVDGTSGSGTFWVGGTYTKTLTSGDIATGSVSFGTASLWNACVVTFSGAVSVSTFISSRAQATPATLTTSGAAVAGNTAIYFGSQGATPGGSTGAVTWNRGTSRGTANDGANDACAVYTETITSGTAGTVTAVVSYASPTAAHNFQTIVVVSTNSTAPGTIPEISQSQISGFPAVADTGTANAYAVATSPAFGLVKGAFISFIAGNANTGASTLSLNGGTAVAIKANGNTTALPSGAITAGQVVDVTYDGTVWQMVVPVGITLTTTGSSGASTLSGGVLNIPVYTSGGSGSGLILLEEHTASNSSSLSFTSSFTSTYDCYLIKFVNLVPVTNSSDIAIRFSTNGGSSYDSGSNYNQIYWLQRTGTNSGGEANNTSFSISVGGVSSTGSNGGACADMEVYNPLSATAFKQARAKGMYYYATGSQYVLIDWANAYLSTTAVNAFQVITSSGNIASGTVRVYGYAK
jgi:hypothetical protein